MELLKILSMIQIYVLIIVNIFSFVDPFLLLKPKLSNCIKLNLLNKPTDLIESIHILEKFDREYIERMKLARASGISPKLLEFNRIQNMTAQNIQHERAIYQYG